MKAKPILVVIITLVIGFILGMLTSAEIRYHKLKPVKMFFSAEKFRDGLYRTIQPDEQQKAKIDLILDKYAKINGDLQNNFRREFDASMKDFRKEIDSNLSKEQLNRLKEMDERRHEMIRNNRKNHLNDTLRYRDRRDHHQEGRPMPDDPPPPPFPDRDSAGFIR
jgi:hypothetical protein